MSSLEQRAPFRGEFKNPVVSLKDRNAIQILLLPADESEQPAWVAAHADNVSRAFMEDAELVRLAKTDHQAAAARLKWILAAMQKNNS